MKTERIHYSAHIEGFEKTFPTLDELRVWANRIISEYGLSGSVLQVRKAVNCQIVSFRNIPT